MIESDNEINFNGRNKKKNIPEKNNNELDYYEPNTSLGANAMYMRKEAWHVIKELIELYTISKNQAIDIVMDQLINFKLQDGDDVIEKTAMFRIAC